MGSARDGLLCSCVYSIGCSPAVLSKLEKETRGCRKLSVLRFLEWSRPIERQTIENSHCFLQEDKRENQAQD